MDFSNETLESLGREAKARIDQGDKAKERSEQMYISAGLYLIEAKARVERTKGLTWAKYLADHCPVGKSRSYELIAIADGRKTVEEVKATTAKRQADYAERNPRRPSANGQSSEKTQQKQRSPVDEARDEADAAVTAQVKRIIAMVKKLDASQRDALETKLKEITQ